ncbi:MAG: hypothetical protein ACPG4Z_07445 [Chitinophagales bacterium]
MLALGFIGLSVFVFILVMIGYNHTISKTYNSSSEKKKAWIYFFGFWIVWFVYLTFLSTQNILAGLSLPPRFLYLLLLPLILFIIFFVRKFKDSPLVHNLPKTWVSGIQTYRIAVETLLHFTFVAGVIPASATFNGFNFDILVGLSAPLMVLFFFRKTNFNKIIAKLWNVWGILMIFVVVVVIATSNYFPQLWGSDVSLVADEFFQYPYLLVAGFLAPLAIFLHVVSLLQLRKS